MQTRFTLEQLSQPDLQESNAILRKCVHCGFCLATCPTYKLLGDELDSPRGRIYLMKNMLESGAAPEPEVVLHVDRCLSCLSCMTTCPSGVNYMHLVDYSRAYIERRYRRPLVDRLKRNLFAFFLTRPGLFRSLLKLIQSIGFLSNFFPSRLRDAMQLRSSPLMKPGNTRLQRRYDAEGTVRGNVALLPGCVQQTTKNDINGATIRLLNRLGYNVHILTESDCCGAIEHHLGKSNQSHARMAANIRNWRGLIEKSRLQAIIVNASGCGTQLKDYVYLFREDAGLAEAAAGISRLTFDITEFLSRVDLATLRFRNGIDLNVAYQSPCSMQHGQGIKRQPVDLLRRFGFTVTEIDEAHLCCGSAGTYNLLQTEIAARLGERKAMHIEAASPDIVASGNLGCMVQVGRYLGNIPIVHTVQLLDWASGGPEPGLSN